MKRLGDSRHTEVHVLGGTTNGPIVKSTCTALGQTDADWAFDTVDWNKDGVSDLVAIDRTDTGSNSTAVHVLSGANANTFLASSRTALHQTNGNWSFAVTQWNGDGVPDIVAINRADTSSNSTAFHVISGANPQVFLKSSGTVLRQTNANWDFSVVDWNKDGTPDIVAVDRADAGSNSTAFHVINGATPSTYVLSRGTVLHQTTAAWSFDVLDWNRDGTPDVAAFDRTDAGSNSTAFHVINGATPTAFVASSRSGLHQTDSTWQFAAVVSPPDPPVNPPVDGAAYPAIGATDCSAQFGIYSWCISGSWLSSRGYAYRNCTDWASWRLQSGFGVADSKIRGLGHGGWWSGLSTIPDAIAHRSANGSVQSRGVVVDSTPSVGAAAVVRSTTSNYFGHVAVIESVSGSTVTVSEFNKAGTGLFGTRTGTLASLGFTDVVHF